MWSDLLQTRDFRERKMKSSIKSEKFALSEISFFMKFGLLWELGLNKCVCQDNHFFYY
jgi:hypothetical protein